MFTTTRYSYKAFTDKKVPEDMCASCRFLSRLAFYNYQEDKEYQTHSGEVING